MCLNSIRMLHLRPFWEVYSYALQGVTKYPVTEYKRLKFVEHLLLDPVGLIESSEEYPHD